MYPDVVICVLIGGHYIAATTSVQECASADPHEQVVDDGDAVAGQ